MYSYTHNPTPLVNISKQRRGWFRCFSIYFTTQLQGNGVCCVSAADKLKTRAEEEQPSFVQVRHGKRFSV